MVQGQKYRNEVYNPQQFLCAAVEFVEMFVKSKRSQVNSWSIQYDETRVALHQQLSLLHLLTLRRDLPIIQKVVQEYGGDPFWDTRAPPRDELEAKDPSFQTKLLTSFQFASLVYPPAAHCMLQYATQDTSRAWRDEVEELAWRGNQLTTAQIEQITGSPSSSLALHYAASNGHLKVLQQFPVQIINASKCTCTGMAVVHTAAAAGSLDCLKWLHDQHLLIPKAEDSEEALPILEQTDKHSNTCLTWAAWAGQLEVVKWLCSEVKVPNSTDRGGLRALLIAARGGNLEVVQWLIESKFSDPETEKSQSGNNALHWASAAGSLPVVKWLVTKGYIEVDCVSEQMASIPLQWAVQYNQCAVAEWLVQDMVTKRRAIPTKVFESTMKKDNVKLLKILTSEGNFDYQEGKWDYCLGYESSYDVPRWLVDSGLHSLYTLPKWLLAPTRFDSVVSMDRTTQNVVMHFHQLPQYFRVLVQVVMWLCSNTKRRMQEESQTLLPELGSIVVQFVPWI
eukprot:TRINITY_DN66935_c7_g3_i1.p1 TRINITY_DN66935_c7_g3~~TRINITY_DN66935_c7_g3_i1.p1  ORF type:complete len:508 (-),score=38.38 TRINITY_DN66935_c7_g3_i1:123-1646(-)